MSRPIVLSGPSGVGKSTLLKRLMSNHPSKFALSVSHTTRAPRAGETNGVEYWFVTRPEMQMAIDNDEFIEHVQFGGNLYGISRKSIEHVQSKNCICILDLEKQGCEHVRTMDLNCLFVMIKPPSIEELERRLRSRNTESENSIQTRLSAGIDLLEYASLPGKFNHVIENDNMDVAYVEFERVCCSHYSVLFE